MARHSGWMVAASVALLGVGAQGCASQPGGFRFADGSDHRLAASAVAGNHEGEDSAAVARRLHEMEQAACVDVAAAERDAGPFARREWISGLEPLSGRASSASRAPQPAGIAVYLKAASGLTEQHLGQVLECHLAHHAAVGDRVSTRSPLFVDDVRVAMSSTGTGFRIAITTHDVAAAREVVDRAYALVE